MKRCDAHNEDDLWPLGRCTFPVHEGLHSWMTERTESVDAEGVIYRVTDDPDEVEAVADVVGRC